MRGSEAARHARQTCEACEADMRGSEACEADMRGSEACEAARQTCEAARHARQTCEAARQTCEACEAWFFAKIIIIIMRGKIRQDTNTIYTIFAFIEWLIDNFFRVKGVRFLSWKCQMFEDHQKRPSKIGELHGLFLSRIGSSFHIFRKCVS